MSFILYPWQLLVLILAGLLNREQQEVIDYPRTENQVLREKLGKKRVLLCDRRRLAVKGRTLGRKRLGEIGISFTPDTILRWHRDVLASVDFTTVEVWTSGGLVTFYLLFVMEGLHIISQYDRTCRRIVTHPRLAK